MRKYDPARFLAHGRVQALTLAGDTRSQCFNRSTCVVLQLEPGDTLHLVHPSNGKSCSFQWPLPAPGASPITTERHAAASVVACKGDIGSKLTAKRKKHSAKSQATNGIFQGCVAIFVARLHLGVMQSRFQARFDDVLLPSSRVQSSYSPRSLLGTIASYMSACRPARLRTVRLQAEGGVIASVLSRDTTHIIASTKTEPVERTTARLANEISSWCKQEAGQAPDDQPDVTGAICGSALSAAQVAAHLRDNVAFVTATWISSSLADASRLPEAEFAEPTAAGIIDTALGTPAIMDSVIAASATDPASVQSAPARGTTPAPPVIAREPVTPRATAAVPDAHIALQTSSNASEQALQSGRAKTAVNDGLLPAGSALTDWQPAGWTAADWGEAGVWLEPFALSSVHNTLGQLYRHYHRLDMAEPPRVDLPLSASQSPIVASLPGARAPTSPSQAQAGAAVPCGHPACASASVCIVNELEKTTQQYIKGRGVDTFRLFATKRALAAVQTHDRPLESDEDVDKLHLGAHEQ